MAKNDIKTTDNPRLKSNIVKDGAMLSLYLEYYLGYNAETDPDTGKTKLKAIRKKKKLNLYTFANPKTPIEKEHNRQTMTQAEILRDEARKEMLNGQGFAFDSIVKSKSDFYRWMQNYCDDYKKTNCRIVRSVAKSFQSFIAASPKYRQFAKVLPAKSLTADMMADFAEHLKATHKGEGALTYWKPFHQAMKKAKREGYISADPCDGICVEIDKSTKTKKEMLTIEEENQLLSCRPAWLNNDTYRAFTLTLRYSPAYCDVKKLTWGNIEDVNGTKRLKYERNKTHVAIDVALDADTLAILGTPGRKSERLFPNLQSNAGVNKALEHWCKEAGIAKHITWHCGRHSFCSNAMAQTNDPISTAAIAGHVNPSMTLNVYSHAQEAKKQSLTDTMSKAYREAATGQNKPQGDTAAPSLDGMTTDQLKDLLAEILKKL